MFVTIIFMLPRLLTTEWFSNRSVGIKLFAQWFTENNKDVTGINLGNFFTLHFEIQLGFYLNWLYDANLIINYDTKVMWLDDVAIQGIDSPYARGDIKKRTMVIQGNRDILHVYEDVICMYLIVIEVPF